MEKHSDLAKAVILEESLPGWNLSLPSHYKETDFAVLLTFRWPQHCPLGPAGSSLTESTCFRANFIFNALQSKTLPPVTCRHV